jgi:CBS domain containing-hemolysin-like protein
MPSDSDSKTGTASDPQASTQIVPADARGPAESGPRSLLSEMASRLAHAVKSLSGGSTIRESLEEVIEESDREIQELSAQERMMLANLLKFGDLTVADVMVPRADIVAVEEQTRLSDLVMLFRDAQHSRLPIYRETLDDPIGMVHIKDVLSLVEPGPDGNLFWKETAIAKVKRDVMFVPGAMPALDLLLKMQTTHQHLALVVDEYGGTDGLVTIEDLVEEIVGDIEDEHDVDEDLEIVPRGDGYVADARVNLEEFKERTGVDLEACIEEADEEEVDTLGGVIVAMLGRVPVRGEIVTREGYEFEILEADPRRVKRLRIRARPMASITAEG